MWSELFAFIEAYKRCGGRVADLHVDARGVYVLQQQLTGRVFSSWKMRPYYLALWCEDGGEE